MSNADILDLMKFVAVVKVERLFNIVKSKHVDCYVEDSNDFDRFIKRIRFVTLERISIFYELTKIKLRDDSAALLYQFKRECSCIHQDAEVSLKNLFIDDMKLSEENYIEQNMHEVFVIKSKKEKQDGIMSASMQNTFWSAYLQDLSKKLIQNSRQRIPISLLPIVMCFFDEKNINIKIGILREECPNIIWLKNDFTTGDKHFKKDVHLLKYCRIDKFLLLNFVFEEILQEKSIKLVSIEKQETKINGRGVKYLVMTTSASDINHFPEDMKIKNCPIKNNLHKWLSEQNVTTIYAFFVKTYQNRELLGMAEVTNFNRSHLFLSWCLKSPDGVQLTTEPKVLGHLNDQFFVIENGKQMAEEYEKKCTEQDVPSMDELQNDGDKKQGKVDSLIKGFANMSFGDIYQNVFQSDKKLPIQYFIFISRTNDYYSELRRTISENLQSYDESAMNLFFVADVNMSRILSLHKLEFYNDESDLQDLQIISLELLQTVTNEPKSAGELHPCERGKELLKLYYECLNPRPAHLLHTSNSCYLVSMLQCIKACFDSKEVDEIYDLLDKNKTPLSFTFFRLLDMMFCNTDRSIDTTDLREELGKYNKKFDDQSQQDGYDFLMCLINNIERELIQHGFSIGILSRKFVFEIQTTWKCKIGHFDGTTQKDYAVILTPQSPMVFVYNNSLEIGEADLRHCWEKMFSTEKMDEILCQKCPEESRVSKGELETSLINLPEFLIVYINRWDPKKKSKNEVSLRFELDDFAVKKKDRVEHYEAVAFCTHLGSLDSGHYKAYVRGNKDNVWFICDDINDRHEALMYNQSYACMREVYTIFYRKK